MTKWLLVLCLVAGAAYAQEEKALLEGRAVLVTRGIDAEVQIVYDQPDMPLILRGTWQDPPNGVLDGMAYVHREGCQSFEYKVKGVVDRSGALMVFGYEPQIGDGCAQTGSLFKALRFTLPPATLERKPKPKVKPKPKPKPKPRPAPQPQYQQPYWQPWQWRT